MRLRTPATDRELLAVPDFAAVPELVARNRRLLDSSPVVIDGIPLPDLRRLARRELLDRDHPAPLVVTGHQPEPFHPGVWVKNFAACGLAKRLGGSAVNLIVDSDVLKGGTLPVPTWERWEPESVRIANVPFAAPPGDRTWEAIAPDDEFDSFPRRLTGIAKPWGFEPLAIEAWPAMAGGTLGERFVSARTRFEREWGCSNLEVRTNRLGRSTAFRHFANHLARDRERFRENHNGAVREYRRIHRLRSRTHPVPELADGEVPFWHVGERGREKVSLPFDPDRIRPRALTLTLFARLCLGDLFIHGIGGGKYDAVTDAIIRSYFGIDPPAFQVVSATLHLPLPRFPSGPEDVKRLRRLVRDLHWNPQRYRTDGTSDHERLRRVEAGRARYRAFRALGERLRPGVVDRIEAASRELIRAESETAANAILQRRDYSWLLYPENLLRPFLQDAQRRANAV